MSDPTPTPPPTASAARPERLELRAALLLVLMAVLVVGSGLYLLYARGAFEPTQRLVLVADDSEGVLVGMDVTFSGFPIGRVRRIELGADGSARILVDVPSKDARWLRTSSVFTLTRGVLGNTNLRAYSGILADPPLPDGAERKVLLGDATAEIPQLVAAARELVANLSTLSAQDSALAGTLANVQALTARANGPGGALGALSGDPQDAARLAQLLDRGNQLMSRLDGLVGRTDGLVGRADVQVFGDQGLVPDLKASVQQLHALLTDARATLQRVDGVLEEAHATAKNVRSATTDLDALRAEVEASLRKVDQLAVEINRKWPFKRETELKLP
jgi:phospholipid/cholesterol/gamma-HCH transport system substrate-binding protein